VANEQDGSWIYKIFYGSIDRIMRVRHDLMIASGLTQPEFWV
jgi:hypothetical protein